MVHAFLHHEDFLLYDGKVIPWKQREKSHRHMDTKLFFSIFCTGNCFILNKITFYLEIKTSQNDCGHEIKTILVMIHLQNLYNESNVFDNTKNLEFEMLTKITTQSISDDT